MEKQELRKTLAIHLDTLKRNREAVPLEVLKTKYKKPYDKLKQDISSAASDILRQKLRPAYVVCGAKYQSSIYA